MKKNMIYASIPTSKDAGAVHEQIKGLKQDGWTDIEYHPFVETTCGDPYATDTPPRITGYRPLTAKEISSNKKIRERKQKLAKIRKWDKENKDVATIWKLAKKYGFTIVKEKT